MELTFAWPMAFLALPLAVLPVVLHVRARARERAVDFPGAFFLQDPALPSAERRRKLEDALLLVLRCLLLGLVVCALAGPRLKGVAWLAPDARGAGREAVVVVLDDSPSLSHRLNAPRQPAFEPLVRELARTLSTGRDRRVAIETTSGRSLGWTEASDLPRRLAEWSAEPVMRSGDRTAAMNRAHALLAGGAEDRRVALLLTDGERNAGEGAGEALDARWRAVLKTFHEPGSPVLAVAAVAPGLEPQWTVEAVQPVLQAALGSARAPVEGQPYGLAVRVRCHRGAGTRTLRLESMALPQTGAAAGPAAGELKPQLERAVSLDEGQAVELEVPGLAAVPGAYWYRASLDGADERSYDDMAEAVVRVLPRREVVLWDLRGITDDSSLAGHARTALAAALDPLAGTGQSRVRLLQPAAPRLDELPPQGIVVALLGVSAAGKLQTVLQAQGAPERLYGMVQEGLKLLWVPDLASQPETWPALGPNQRLAADVLFPRGIERAEAANEGRPAWRLGLTETAHPLLAPFFGGRNGDLGGVKFSRRLRLGVEQAHSRLPGAWEPEQVLARFEDGQPALVYLRIGSGSLGQLAIGPEPAGGITASAAWPVLLQEYIEWAASDGLGAEPGPQAAVAVVPPAWPVAPRGRPRRFGLEGPLPLPGSASHAAGARWELPVPARGEQLALPELSSPGVYRLTQLETLAPVPQRWAVCRMAPEESSLESLPEKVRDALAAAAETSGGAWVNVSGADGFAPVAQALERLRPGSPLAPWLWTLFLACMTLELVILIARRRTG